MQIRNLVIWIRGSGSVSKRIKYGTLAKAPEKTVWKDNGERQKGKKKMKTRGKEKRRQWEDTWENNGLTEVRRRTGEDDGRVRRVMLVTFSLL